MGVRGEEAGGGCLGLSGGVFNRFGVVLWLVFGVLGGCSAFSVGLSVFWCGCGFVFLGFELENRVTTNPHVRIILIIS
jgi:hypothetical protein